MDFPPKLGFSADFLCSYQSRHEAIKQTMRLFHGMKRGAVALRQREWASSASFCVLISLKRRMRAARPKPNGL
jgi:hypothetical protein